MKREKYMEKINEIINDYSEGFALMMAHRQFGMVLDGGQTYDEGWHRQISFSSVDGVLARDAMEDYGISIPYALRAALAAHYKVEAPLELQPYMTFEVEL